MSDDNAAKDAKIAELERDKLLSQQGSLCEIFDCKPSELYERVKACKAERDLWYTRMVSAVFADNANWGDKTCGWFQEAERKWKAHSEDGWAVVVTWNHDPNRTSFAWSESRVSKMDYANIAHKTLWPIACFTGPGARASALDMKARFCDGNDSVKSARVVRVRVTEQRKRAERKA